jgi:Glycogen debranching enzyme
VILGTLFYLYSMKFHTFLETKLYLSLVFLSIGLAITSEVSANNKSHLMKEAVPVWAENRENEMNLNLGFRTVFEVKNPKSAKIKIAASTLYRIYINGEFVGSGPARAAHKYYRVDEYELTDRIKPGKENILAIEVAGYNINSYYTLDQPSFLLTELEADGKIILASGKEKPVFEAFVLEERLQKVERYSFQRPFTEYYRMKDGYDKWRTSSKMAVKKIKLQTYPTVNLLPRRVLMPEFKVIEPVSVLSKGTIVRFKPDHYFKDRSLVNIGPQLKGYKEEELEVKPSQEIQELKTSHMEMIGKPYSSIKNLSLQTNDFYIFNMGVNYSGFIGAKLHCKKPSKIYFHFDELLTNDDVISKKRMADVNNQIVYELQPGTYDLETLEAYTFKYLKIMVLEGGCRIENIYLREFTYPENEKAWFQSSNFKLNAIFEAAKQTFNQNSVDLFTDCPSRERAGWLCDNYFSSIMEKELTGDAKIAYNFLENYALPEKFDHLPDGMVPMCYPADHNDGNFIPNWSLWLIVHLEDYAQRGGDKALIKQLQPRIEKLLKYFERFENESGLLEKLEKWVFVEWSKANELVQDVNYPTNMLYYGALRAAGILYYNSDYLKKAEHVKKEILSQSFNGEFFVDNALRANEEIKITNNTTEVCQYYAFFFNIATPDSHPKLWKRIRDEFGPTRNTEQVYPNVYPANAFIGNYLRMALLAEQNLQSQLLSEIQEYFFSMAERTGTLWEFMQHHASCNHGFASYLGHVIYANVLGVKKIDYINKEISLSFNDIPLNDCKGSVPIGDDCIELHWNRSGETLFYSFKAPAGYKVKIENNSSAVLKKK